MQFGFCDLATGSRNSLSPAEVSLGVKGRDIRSIEMEIDLLSKLMLS